MSWIGGDPDPYDVVTYDVYFDDYNPPTLVEKNQSENWWNPDYYLSKLQTYYWKIVAWDNHGASTAGPVWNFNTNNTPVPPPPTIDGPQFGKVGIEYEYTFSVKDNGCNNVSIYIAWDDGKTNRTPFIEPGVEIKLNHTWYHKGNYIIRANAKDIHGLVSDWSTFEITMPRNKIIHYSLFLKFLDKFTLIKFLLEILEVI